MVVLMMFEGVFNNWEKKVLTFANRCYKMLYYGYCTET